MPESVTYSIQDVAQEVWKPASINSTTTIGISGTSYHCDATSAAFTVNLPDATLYNGRILSFKKVDASANAITIDGNGSQTIDGATTVALGTQWDVLVIQSDGANWLILSAA